MAGELILIVDDIAVNLKLTRILLVNEGYKVLTAAVPKRRWTCSKGSFRISSWRTFDFPASTGWK
jgi:CheY-like chemotaxis protein